jgi:hypothetical protein
MKQRLLPMLCILCVVDFLVLSVPKGVCDNEISVNVKFDIFTGSGSPDYYSGDYFWYNITLQNSGTTVINATFTVIVLNTTGGVMPDTNTFVRNLAPNDTTYFYPNFTRLGKEEYSVFFMDTAGTYTIELNSSLSMYYYRWYNGTGRYTFEYNVCYMNIDAMPSYQKQLNDAQKQYVQQSENYLNNIQTYLAQSKAETTNTQLLAKTSLCVAIIAIMADLFTLPKTRLKERKGFIAAIVMGLILYVIIAFFIL